MTHTHLVTEEPLIPARYGTTTREPLKVLVGLSDLYGLRPPANQVREDRTFYVPDLLSDEHYDTDRQAYSTATDQARHLRNAERLLDEALNLVGLMRAAIGDHCDSRAMQSEIALTIIEKKLRKAYDRIDKHDRHYTNLFLAYADLSGKKDQGNKD